MGFIKQINRIKKWSLFNNKLIISIVPTLFNILACMLTLPSKEDMLASLQEEHDINNKTTPPLSRFFHLSNLEGYSYLDYHRDLSKLTNLPINEVHYNEVKRLDGETGRLIKQGKAWEIKFIDWGSVMGDYDYHTTSDKF